MKTKLLRKVKKDYSIYRYDYPRQLPEFLVSYHDGEFILIGNIRDLKFPLYCVKSKRFEEEIPSYTQTLNEAREAILDHVRTRYSKYTRRYREMKGEIAKNYPVKVW